MKIMTLPLSMMHLVSVMHILIFFTTFHQLLKLIGPGHFLKSIFALFIDYVRAPLAKQIHIYIFVQFSLNVCPIL